MTGIFYGCGFVMYNEPRAARRRHIYPLMGSGDNTKGNTMTKLDNMTHAQRAAFGRRLYGHTGLPPNAIGTRLLMERIKGRAN